MEYITSVLFVISNGLMIPVLILLLYFLVRSIVAVATYYHSYRSNRTVLNTLAPALNVFTGRNTDELSLALEGIAKSEIAVCMAEMLEHPANDALNERIVANYEVDAQKILFRSRSLVKFGPVLGLMGTLIPMGPALVGLASGNIASMAYNMQVAFATTVVGMFVAAVGVARLQSDKYFLAKNINNLEFVRRKLAETSAEQ